ncbi:putative Dehydrogenase [uncultured Alphaproteobacteria bacterium]|uniref:Putative Dehydrogenase n=1 Tax=uncultured Alphaproteobacteria bacterium TaxID=91750 RepID=A0A212JTW0_9PROT|nr:putative Dehydrogenase [uncultured Alphaproteobacteria bacterium]
MPKIVVLDSHQYPDGAYAELAALCAENGVDFAALDCRSSDDIVAKAADAEVLIDIFLPIDHAVLSRLPRCRMVVRHGIGVDVLTLDDFTRDGVVACNVPDYGVEEVAVHALSLLLALERKVAFYDRQVRAGTWNESLGYEMRRLSLRTLGFVGFGRIARTVASYARAIGYALVAFDPYLPAARFAASEARQASLDEVLAAADALMVMAPMTAETRGIINDRTLAQAKDGLLLINTARGPLVETAALDRALASGKVAGAALDVLEEEPPAEKTHSLLRHDNVIVTPHVAYRSRESFAALKLMCGEIGIDFLKGRPPRNVVNPAVLTRMRQA